MDWSGGVRQGLLFGIGFFAIALVVRIMTAGPGSAGEEQVPLSLLFAGYLLSGTFSGALVGLWRDVDKGPALKIVVALSAALPVSIGMALSAEGSGTSRPREWADSRIVRVD